MRYGTRDEAIERLILEALREHAQDYDIEGLAADTLERDGDAYVQSVDDEAWRTVARRHEWIVTVRPDGVATVATEAQEAAGRCAASFPVTYSEDVEEWEQAADEALSAAGWSRRRDWTTSWACLLAHVRRN